MHSLENDTQIQTKIGKIYTRFQTKTAQKSDTLIGAAHTPIREYPRGEHGQSRQVKAQVCCRGLQTVTLLKTTIV